MTSTPRFVFIAPSHRRNELQTVREETLVDAWRSAIEEIVGSNDEIRIDVHEGKLQEIDPKLLQCECMVSPANSFGIMDGGYDYELSLAFMGESHDPLRLTRHVQQTLWSRWKGYGPPSSCTLVPLPSDVSGVGKNPWSASVLAVVPTMRVPEDVSWDQDLVYNSMWSLLVEISHWNENVAHAEHNIKTVVMTGLATGTGRMSVKRCARQMVLAIKHFHEGYPQQPDWNDVLQHAREIKETI